MGGWDPSFLFPSSRYEALLSLLRIQSSDTNESDAMDDSDSSGSRDESLDTSSNHPRYNYQYSDDDGGNIKPINTQRAQKIESAMSNVWEVINKYGSASLPSLDPADIDEKGWKIDKGSPWSDVSAAMEEIVSAREAMHEALQKDADGEENTNDEEKERVQPPESPPDDPHDARIERRMPEKLQTKVPSQAYILQGQSGKQDLCI